MHSLEKTRKPLGNITAIRRLDNWHFMSAITMSLGGKQYYFHGNCLTLKAHLQKQALGLNNN